MVKKKTTKKPVAKKVTAKKPKIDIEKDVERIKQQTSKPLYNKGRELEIPKGNGISIEPRKEMVLGKEKPKTQKKKSTKKSRKSLKEMI